jgi:glyoxylase-like metal-dependent hydrolase (beta-lactamase superfamily II)
LNRLPEGIRFIERDWLSCNQVLMCDSTPAIWQSKDSPGHFPKEAGSRPGPPPVPSYTLIDSGYSKHQALTLQLVMHWIGQGRLSRLINTHLHSDHCGGNARLAESTGCEIVVPQASLTDVQAWDTEALSYAGTGQHCPRFRAGSALKPGDTFDAGGLRWQVHAAPGHDAKSLIFFAPQEGLLISADAFWENGFGILFPELIGDSGMAEQEAVLDLIEALNPRLVLPGHGSMFADVGAALTRARSRLRALREKPERNPRNAIKALVKFALLDQEKLHIENFIETQSKTSINIASAKQLGQPLPDLLRVAFVDLSRIGAARLEGEYAWNAEPDLP